MDSVGNLRELQLQELEILQMFSKFCERHDLAWYITAGTLLGAVRHKGFIPWDDDIDVAMPRADYDRLAQIASELPDGFFYQDYHTEPLFAHYFAKIRRDGTHVQEAEFVGVNIHQGQYIDIFPLDTCPASSRFAILFFKGIELLSCAARGKVTANFQCGYVKTYMRALYKLLHALPLRLLHKMRELLRRGVDLACGDGRLCTVDGSHGYPQETYEKDWFRQTVTLSFEGEEFPAPVGWHELLSNMYGDYMVPLDEMEQRGHFTKIKEGD